jgi:hypothetical protein
MLWLLIVTISGSVYVLFSAVWFAFDAWKARARANKLRKLEREASEQLERDLERAHEEFWTAWRGQATERTFFAPSEITWRENARLKMSRWGKA